MLVFLVDGLSDVPDKSSALSQANTPNMDRLLGWGKSGSYYPGDHEISPEEDQALMWCLGNNMQEKYPGRGVLEAVGNQVAFTADELVARVDLVRYEDGLIKGLDPEHKMEHVSRLTHFEVRDLLWKITPTGDNEG